MKSKQAKRVWRSGHDAGYLQCLLTHGLADKCMTLYVNRPVVRFLAEEHDLSVQFERVSKKFDRATFSQRKLRVIKGGKDG